MAEVYIPRVGFQSYNTGNIYMVGFGFFDTGSTQIFKPASGGLTLYGRGFERAFNRGFR